MTSKTEILLIDGQFVRRTIQEADLGSQEAMLRKFASSTMEIIRGSFSVNGKSVNLYVNKTAIFAFLPIQELPFKAGYKMVAPGVLHPHMTGGWMNSSKINGHILMDEPFPLTAPELGTTYFVVSYKIPAEGSPPVPGACYLLTYRNNAFYRFPYPNLFDDGRICMGHEWEENMSGGFKTIQDTMVHCYQSFLASSLNSDLVRITTPELFSKSSKDGKWLNGGARAVPYLIDTPSTWLAGFKP
jgi:hypothetical protein